MKKLLCYLKGYEKETVLAPLFKMLEALFELFVPLVMAAVIDQGIGPNLIDVDIVGIVDHVRQKTSRRTHVNL